MYSNYFTSKYFIPSYFTDNILFTLFSIQEAGLKHSELFEELPVILKNSHLANGLLHVLKPTPSYDLLQLSVR